jgi:hypothetical protein
VLVLSLLSKETKVAIGFATTMNPLLVDPFSQAFTCVVTSICRYTPAVFTATAPATRVPCVGGAGPPLPVTVDSVQAPFARKTSTEPGVPTVFTNSRSRASETCPAVVPMGSVDRLN